MISNNLFLFILLISAQSASPFLNSTQNKRWIDRFEMGKKCPLLGAHGVCMFWHVSFYKTRDRSIRLSMDISSDLLRFCLSIDSARTWSWMWRKETHLDAIFNGWVRQKGQKTICLQLSASLPLWSTLKIDSARSIGFLFIWYWAKVKIFWFLALLLRLSASRQIFCCRTALFRYHTQDAFVISIHT